eukprot:TRINITY_DN9600_c0_g1_i1.p1 TRINITY_DN9600_c0_g1~~TRINITY_DN9600_c0_g1_i1.p1  ORF type:complete len:181 (-),score=35.58 TRINITY_DN9600_c0_g1_i1:11-508(-)
MGSQFKTTGRETHRHTTPQNRGKNTRFKKLRFFKDFLKELPKMTEVAECAVCHQPIPKGRVHYGGVSCYSCRAFFRRNTQREELPICKGEGGCRITYMDRKQCSSCRYNKCISTGMRPELVLNEDEKKRRFKKLLEVRKRKKRSNMNIFPEPQYSDERSLYRNIT